MDVARMKRYPGTNVTVADEAISGNERNSGPGCSLRSSGLPIRYSNCNTHSFAISLLDPREFCFELSALSDERAQGPRDPVRRRFRKTQVQPGWPTGMARFCCFGIGCRAANRSA